MNKELEEIRAKVIEACGIGKMVSAEEEIGLSYDITLANVLRAIEAHQSLADDMYAVDTMGTFHKEDDNGDFQCENISWNLALSLDEQESEVIAFLHKILCI